MTNFIFILCLFFGWNASAKTIVLLDTGIKVNKEYKKYILKQIDMTKSGLEDYDGHGTHLFGLLIDFGKSPKNKVISIKIGKINPTFVDYLLGLREAINLNPDIINISFVHQGNKTVSEELILIENMLLKNAESKKIKIVVAAGNNSENLDENPRYPCSYSFKNIYCVGSKSSDGKISDFSNYGKSVKYWENGETVVSFDLENSVTIFSGTSQSAAKFSNKLK